MSQEEIFINGELLRLRREAKGWVLNDMATRACMSVKQIRQLEEGGLSTFYSQAVKVTAAKKVGALLGLSADEVFAHPVSDVLVEQPAEGEVLSSDVSVEPVVEQTHEDIAVEDPIAFTEVEPTQSTSLQTDDSSSFADEAPKKSKTSLWLISALFLAALLVAAYMQPQDEPLSAEPVPPLQVVPTDAVEPASAADSASSSASASVEAASVAKPVASVAVSPASVVRATASASVAVAVRVPSSAPAQVMPAASVASKAQ
jgi:cytoskeleton protein RodZ